MPSYISAYKSICITFVCNVYVFLYQTHERTAERLEEETAGALVRNLWTQVSRDVEQFKFHHSRKLLNRCALNSACFGLKAHMCGLACL